jgi:hypothetical protein
MSLSFFILRAQATTLLRGAIPSFRRPQVFDNKNLKAVATKAFMIVFLATVAGMSIFTHYGTMDVIMYGVKYGIQVWLFAWVAPAYFWVWRCVRHGRVDHEWYWQQWNDAQRFGYSVALAITALILYGLVRKLFGGTDMRLLPALLWGVAGGFVFSSVVMPLLKPSRPAAAKPGQLEDAAVDPSQPQPFGLWLGTSSGVLASLSHGAGMAPGQNVRLALEDACQNVLVLGGIGSGKTTRAIQPLLVQILEQDSGALLFDVKGDFKFGVEKLAAQAGRSVTVIGPGKTAINLLAGLTPEMAASFLKSALILAGGTKGGDAFWIDTATILCQNALGVLSFIQGQYSLEGLYRYLFDDQERERLDALAYDALIGPDLDERSTRLLRSYLAYHENIFSRFDDKVKAGVLASCAQVLAPFTHPDLVDCFCTDQAGQARMEDVLDGTLFLVDMPLSVWGLGGKVAYTFIKLRFFNVMQRRNTVPEWNKTRPVAFICDEYQDVVSCAKDGLSDLSFWDKSRSSKTIGIISSQSVKSFHAAIGNNDMAETILQNFRQQIVFRTEDQATLKRLNYLLGKVEVQRSSYTQNQGESHGATFLQHSTNQGEGESVSVREKDVLDPQLMRRLGPNQALMLLSVGGQSMDDVVNVVPVFV